MSSTVTRPCGQGERRNLGPPTFLLSLDLVWRSEWLHILFVETLAECGGGWLEARRQSRAEQPSAAIQQALYTEQMSNEHCRAAPVKRQNTIIIFSVEQMIRLREQYLPIVGAGQSQLGGKTWTSIAFSLHIGHMKLYTFTAVCIFVSQKICCKILLANDVNV